MVPEHVRGVRGEWSPSQKPCGSAGWWRRGARGGVARALGGAVFGPLGPFPGPFPSGGPR